MLVSQFEASGFDVIRKVRHKVAVNFCVCKLMLVFGCLFLRLEES